jgi:hypothetical protein
MSPSSSKSTGKTKRRAPGGVETGTPSPLAGTRSLLGVARSQRRLLAFAKTAAATVTAGSYNEAYYYINTPYLIDTGVSAAGFAKYMDFYSKCFVVAASIRVVISTVTTGSLVYAPVGITITTNTTSLASSPKAIENGMCDWSAILTSPDTKTFTQKVNIAKFLTKPKVLDDPQLYTTASTQPQQVVVAHVWADNTGGASIVHNHTVEIILDCIFTDPIPFT